VTCFARRWNYCLIWPFTEDDGTDVIQHDPLWPSIHGPSLFTEVAPAHGRLDRRLFHPFHLGVLPSRAGDQLYDVLTKSSSIRIVLCMLNGYNACILLNQIVTTAFFMCQVCSSAPCAGGAGSQPSPVRRTPLCPGGVCSAIIHAITPYRPYYGKR
jgi:hypothetical protein